MNRVPEPEEANDPANIRESARVEFRKFAPPSCVDDIDDRIDRAIREAGILEQLKDRRRHIQKVRWKARKQAVLAWRDFYRDPIRRKLILEDLQREHARTAASAGHATLLQLKPDEQIVFLLRTRSCPFNRDETMKVTGMGPRKTDRVFARAAQKIISSMPGGEKRC